MRRNLDEYGRKYVFTDVDGCLTDGKVTYDSKGNMSRDFSVIDGHGFQLLKESGFDVVIISGEDDHCTRERANKLDVLFIGGVKNKRSLFYQLVLHEYHCNKDDVYYLGDDYPDLEVLDFVGVFATPKDSLIHKRFKDKYTVLESRGGEGAFRDFAEMILEMNRIKPFATH